MAEKVLCVCHDREALPALTLLGQNPWKGFCRSGGSYDHVVPCYGANLESFLAPRREGAVTLAWRRHKLGSNSHKRGPYANFTLPEILDAPCRCNGSARSNRAYRVYRNGGRVIHLRDGRIEEDRAV